MGGGGGGGQAPAPVIYNPPPPPPPTIIQPPAPPPPPNPDLDVQAIQKAANIFTNQYQTQVVDPTIKRMTEQEQARVPIEYGNAGFFADEQQNYLQEASANISNLSTNPSLTAELAAQQTLMQAGLANMQTMMAAAQQRAQYQQAQYLAYQQSVPTQALGFGDVFQRNQPSYGSYLANADQNTLSGGGMPFGYNPNAATLTPFLGGMG